MTTITILPDDPRVSPPQFRAITGDKESVGPTVGQALDALTAQLESAGKTTLIVVQSLKPDEFFSAEQQFQLEALMNRWRTARAAGKALSPEDQESLDALIQAETQASARRASALLSKIPSPL